MLSLTPPSPPPPLRMGSDCLLSWCCLFSGGLLLSALSIGLMLSRGSDCRLIPAFPPDLIVRSSLCGLTLCSEGGLPSSAPGLVTWCVESSLFSGGGLLWSLLSALSPEGLVLCSLLCIGSPLLSGEGLLGSVLALNFCTVCITVVRMGSFFMVKSLLSPGLVL